MRQKIEWLRLRLVLLLLFVCMAMATRSQPLTQRAANNGALKIHQLHSGPRPVDKIIRRGKEYCFAAVFSPCMRALISRFLYSTFTSRSLALPLSLSLSRFLSKRRTRGTMKIDSETKNVSQIIILYESMRNASAGRAEPRRAFFLILFNGYVFFSFEYLKGPHQGHTCKHWLQQIIVTAHRLITWTIAH